MFYFNFEKATTQSLFVIVEEMKSLNFSLNFSKASLVISKLADCCEGLILFGSYASGKLKKGSDLDVVFLGKCDRKKLEEIKGASPIEIHEQVVSFEELGKMISKGHALALEIFDNHILFWDVNKMVNLFWRSKNG